MKSNLQLKNLRHKFSWLLCLVVLLCSANALAEYYMPGSWPGGTWGFGDYNKFVSNKITMSLAANTTYEFKITNGNSWSTAFGVNGSRTMERSTADDIAWNFDGENNCKIKTDIAGDYTFTLNTSEPTLTVTYPTPVQTSYYLKHPWGGGGWEWSNALTDNGNGTYSIEMAYGGSGCNWNTSKNDTGAKWIGSPTLEGGPTSGDNCVFTLNPSAGTITITKKNDCILPTVTTVTATSVGRTSATVGGSYTGGDEIPSEVGIEWVSGKSGKVIASSVATPFTVDLSDLTPGTTYTYKAYAVACDANITYGSNKSFTTPYRCYDGNEYMYFDIKGSYFSDAGAVPNVSFDGGNTYTDAIVVDAENKIYKLLVPAGCYNSMKVRRHGSSYWNQCDISLADIENHNEFIVGNDWTNCKHSWGDYEEQICTAPVASDFNVTDATKTYNGSAQTATITAADGMGAMTAKYAGSTTAPTNAGTYAITVDVAKGTTYCAATGIALGDFTINKADQTTAVVVGDLTESKCGPGDYTLTATGGDGDGMYIYEKVGGTASATISGSTLSVTSIGTVVVKAKRAESDNYNESEFGAEKTITICAPEVIRIQVKAEGLFKSSTPSLYAWYNDGSNHKLTGEWPGVSMTKDGDWYYYNVETSYKPIKIIFSQNGSNQTTDITGISEDKCYTVNDDSKKESEVDCPQPCEAPTIEGHPSTATASYCKGADATALSVTATGTAPLSYQWYSNTTASTLAGTAIAGATLSSYTPSTAEAGTLYYYCVVTGCNAQTATSNVSGAVTVEATPSLTSVDGPAVLCATAGNTETYTTQSVAGATYTWTLSSNLTGSSTSNSITVTTTGVAGAANVEVYASSSAGCNSEVVRADITLESGSSIDAGIISGNTEVCSGSTVTYKNSSTNGTVFNWSVPDGWTIASGQGTNKIKVNVGTSSGYVGVSVSNSCGGDVPAPELPVTVLRTPATPESITGNATVCKNVEYTYSTPDNGAEEYIWKLPAGWSASCTADKTTIKAVPGPESVSGNIKVKAKSDCGESEYYSMAVTVNGATLEISGVGAKSASATYPWQPMVLTSIPDDVEVDWSYTYSTTLSETSTVFVANGNSATLKSGAPVSDTEHYTVTATTRSADAGCQTSASYDVYINSDTAEVCAK